jgi:hypothetical protein
MPVKGAISYWTTGVAVGLGVVEVGVAVLSGVAVQPANKIEVAEIRVAMAKILRRDIARD